MMRLRCGETMGVYHDGGSPDPPKSATGIETNRDDWDSMTKRKAPHDFGKEKVWKTGFDTVYANDHSESWVANEAVAFII